MSGVSRRGFLVGSAAAVAAASAMSWGDTMTDDPRLKAEYLDRKIKHVDDAELFASLDLTRTELADVRVAAEKKDWPAAYAAWGKYWTSIAPARGRFSGEVQYVGTRDEALRAAEGSRDVTLAAAELLLKHNIKGWGDVAIQHGAVVDFNADYGKSGKYGFHYWFWAQPLITAFLLTEDQKYLDGFEVLFNQWYEQRDAVHGDWNGLDAVYYELGLGARNRVFLEYYFLPQAKRSAQTHERMLKTMLGAARWLSAEESLGYRSGNWQMIGSYGMALIGLMLPELKESRAWVTLASNAILEHLQKDFYADGCHSERCPSSYMGIVYRDPRNLAKLLSEDPSQRELAEKIRQPLERSLNFWLGILPPDKVMPGINDGARSWMPAMVFEDGAKLFGRKDVLWAAEHLLGGQAKDDGTKPAFTSVQFPISGFSVMRSDWTKDAKYLLINHGPYGGGHSHADSLSFELNAFGTVMAIDSGLGLTYDEPEYAAWYVRSRAHNMITIDGDDLDRTAAEGKDVAWLSNDRLDHFAATHHGYAATKGIVHRRQIVFVKPDYFVIFDRIDATAAKTAHSLEWNLHRTVSDSAGPGLIVRDADGWTASKDTAIASVLGVRGFDGPHAKIEWLKLSRKIEAGAKTTAAVLLFPFADSPPDVRIERVGDEQFVIHRPGGADRISFSVGGVTVE